MPVLRECTELLECDGSPARGVDRDARAGAIGGLPAALPAELRLIRCACVYDARCGCDIGPAFGKPDAVGDERAEMGYPECCGGGWCGDGAPL